MNEAARSFIGTHNFSSFCRASSETRNRVCTVSHAEWEPERRAGNWSFVISADRFLHGMVRSIVGTLIDVGHERRPAGDLDAILQSEDRRSAGAAAPPRGLILEYVRYASDEDATTQPPSGPTPAEGRPIGH
jgi:tRNA pseudouridine38-40 synthase